MPSRRRIMTVEFLAFATGADIGRNLRVASLRLDLSIRAWQRNFPNRGRSAKAKPRGPKKGYGSKALNGRGDAVEGSANAIQGVSSARLSSFRRLARAYPVARGRGFRRSADRSRRLHGRPWRRCGL